MGCDRVGMTTTLPVEVIFAGGMTPVDLNNLFVGDANAYNIVLEAEKAGFPQNSCAWVKGLYKTAEIYNLNKIACVREGDCSQNIALEDIWRSDDVEVIPFSYPYTRTQQSLQRELDRFAAYFGTNITAINDWKLRLDEVRRLAAEIDAIAVAEGTVTSLELFISQLNLTALFGDVGKCERSLVELLAQVKGRKQGLSRPRLGVLGVPTILTDLSDVIEELGARVVYHEVPYEFSMIKSIGKNIIDTYLDYTYPYAAEVRLEAIQHEIRVRELDGLIHYTQSFCHRQIHDLLMRREFDIPLLTIEADRPAITDGRTLTRIEAFIEQLR